MAQILNIEAAELALDHLGLQRTEGFFWKPELRPVPVNCWFTPDEWVNADAIKWQDEVPLVGGQRYPRWRRGPEPGDVQRLTSVFRASLASLGHSRLVLSTPGFYPRDRGLTPWFHEFDIPHLKGQPAESVFADLGICVDDNPPVEAQLPEDLEKVTAVAEWCWIRYGRNLYCFVDDTMKIVVCHETDLHFCARNLEPLQAMLHVATNAGLHLAPLQSQQCA